MTLEIMGTLFSLNFLRSRAFGMRVALNALEVCLHYQEQL